MTETDLISTTDAKKWAVEFCRLNHGTEMTVSSMLGWFANAIETGRNAGRKELCPHPIERRFECDDLVLCNQCGKNLSD